MKKKKKRVQPKTCPHCGAEFYALFTHLDACVGARRAINNAVKAALSQASKQSKFR